MAPEEVDRFVRFNEEVAGPARRVVLRLGGSYAVVLLNDAGLPLLAALPALAGARLTPYASAASGVEGLALALPGCEIDGGDQRPPQITSWELLYDDGALIVPTRTAKPRRPVPPAVGIVITGKQNLREGAVVAGATVLDKNTPTPFLADGWGDSWNDNFDLEPRVVDAVPATVWACIRGILDAGKRAWAAGDFAAAAQKYQKAFHYSHRYFPDTLDAEDLRTAADLKMRSLLNLSAASLKLGTDESLRKCVEAGTFLLGMPECVGLNRAKSLYRTGRARLLLGDDELARRELVASLELVDDPETRRALQQCDEAQRRRELAMRDRLKTAFS